MALPANVDTGLVTGRFLVGVIDGPDPDDDPDGLPAQGTITFTASVPYLPNPTADPAPVTILKAPIVGALDSDGYLCVRGADGTVGARGVRLVATDDPDLSVQGWTWTVTYAFETVNGVRPQIASHSMALPADATVDLTTVVRVPSSTGIGVEQAEALAASAQAAAAQSAADVAAAREAAQEAAQAAQPTDTGVAALVTYGGATTTVLETQYRRDVDLREYGASGDGITDDTAAIRAAIRSGRALHWGGPERVYRITEAIEETLTAPASWRSAGATIRGDLADPATYLLTLHAEGHDITIDGGLAIDAARTAHTCLRLWNRGVPAAMRASDLTALNAHRSNAALAGGDGIEVAGAWSRVSLTRPTVRSITMAVGAGVSGSRGVSGIYVHDINRGDGTADTPHIVRIDDPYIEDIYSEDPEWMVDQDGIRVFGGSDQPGQTAPILTQATISGGEVRNSRGRAVKSQTHLTTVDGTRIVRAKGGLGITHDIDFQVGGGTVRNIEAVYGDGNVPRSVVNFSGTSTARAVPQRQVSGLKVLTSGDEPLSRAVGILSSSEPRTLTTVSDLTVQHDGAAPEALVMMSGTSGGVQELAASNLVGAPSGGLVRISGGAPDGWDARIAVSSAINTGGEVPLVHSTTSLARHTAATSGVMGYTI